MSPAVVYELQPVNIRTDNCEHKLFLPCPIHQPAAEFLHSTAVEKLSKRVTDIKVLKLLYNKLQVLFHVEIARIVVYGSDPCAEKVPCTAHSCGLICKISHKLSAEIQGRKSEEHRLFPVRKIYGQKLLGGKLCSHRNIMPVLEHGHHAVRRTLGFHAAAAHKASAALHAGAYAHEKPVEAEKCRTVFKRLIYLFRGPAARKSRVHLRKLGGKLYKCVLGLIR